MRKVIITLLVNGFLLAAKAQDIAAIQKEYPGEQVVVLNTSENYKIYLKDDKPVVESTENMQLLFLVAGNATFLNRYKFYHSSFHQVKSYSAYTQTADKKKLKVTEFKTSNNPSSGVFYDDVKETSFDFPGISAGAVANFEASFAHNNSYLLSPFYFKRGIPVIKSKLTVSFPENISVKYALRGNDTSLIKISKTNRRGQVTYVFEGTGLEGEASYADAPSGSYYSPHVVFYIENYIDGAGRTIRHLGTVDDLYALNYSFIKDVNREPDTAVKRLVTDLTKHNTTNTEKARTIYQWVQKNIKYVAFEDGMGGFVPRDGNKVCSRKYGDCKDMTSVLTLMLSAASVPSYFAWIGTRSIPYRYSELPLPIVDNHMIAAIDDGKGGYIFLDGTDPHCLFGNTPYSIQDKEALIAVNEKEYKIVKLPVSKKEKNLLTDSAFIFLTEKGVTGNIRVDLEGYFATELRGEQQYVSEKDNEKFMRSLMARGSNKFLLDKFNAVNAADASRSSYTGSFKLDDYARKIGDEWYINMNLQKLYEHQEIDYPKRKIPVMFDFPFRKRFVTVLQIPEGYKVSSLPRSKSFKNNVWGFDMNYSTTNDKIILTLEFDNDHLLLYPGDFSEWNDVLVHLLPLYKEAVALSKK